MKITKSKKGFILRDCGLLIKFTSYEYGTILNDVYLYKDSVLVAIYGNRAKFESKLRGAKGVPTTPKATKYSYRKD